MIRNYKNEKIYKNLKIVKILSIISIVLSVITVIIFTIYKYVIISSTDIGRNEIFFYLFAFITPINPLVNSIRGLNPAKPSTRNLIYNGDTEKNNDFTNTITAVIFSYSEIIISIFYFIISLFFGGWSDTIIWARYCGYMFIAHLFVYIAAVFLIYNCILIKREWQVNPPNFYLQEQQKNLEEKQRIEMGKKTAMYKKLIEKCGIKFFIKYYKQIKCLPLRDVSVTENYSTEEREERLLSAKTIIDLNLTEFALNEILKTYSDILEDKEVEQVKYLLSELKSS